MRNAVWKWERQKETMADEIDTLDVVYITPEKIAREARVEAVHSITNDPEALLARLDEIDRNAAGKFIQVLGYEVVENIQRPVYGDTLVYIDDAPDDPQDGSGHYEVYDAEKHGEPYHPIPSRRGFETIAIDKEG
jgi:hypothetical protein